MSVASQWQEERELRLAAKQSERLGQMSPGAFEELLLAVHDHPEQYADDGAEKAFAVVVQAQEELQASRREDEFLDDGEYQSALQRRLERLRSRAAEALLEDPQCWDAQLLDVLATPQDALDRLTALRALDERAQQETPLVQGQVDDLWDDVFARPRLRIKAALARTAFEASCFSLARDTALWTMGRAPSDDLGLRYTCALALARLEDEQGFSDLDVRFGRRGNAWANLARSLMLFKLDRLPAARRALKGFLRLNEGAAYALLRPAYVEPYLPDRPVVDPGSYLEAVLAVHEADPVVVDAPDFIDWCSDQPGVLEEAEAFAEHNGYDW